MISNKYITKISVVLVTAAVVLCMLAMSFPENGAITVSTYKMEYEEKLFDTSEIIELDIIMNEDEWNEMLDNATSEEYYKCDVVINGETFYSVGIRPKGNTSLSSIANDPDNNRYSFKMEFDQYVDGQTCYGLDKLVLNNSYADTTNMKESVIYDMYHYLGADASLYNYAGISVNGEYWGLYLALEAVEDSFMLRNYGTEKGYLYKPDSMNMGNRDNDGGAPARGNTPQGMPDMGQMPQFNRNPAEFERNENSTENTPPQMSEPENADIGTEAESAQSPRERTRPGGGMPGGGMRGGFGGGFGGGGPGGGNGANLNYSDDSLDSYSTIWDGAINDSSTADHTRVVTALKNISQGTELEKYLDVDNALKYMAVHSFAVNDDSLSGNMAHNYYLYESGGRLNILPWDYNLAFGGMHGSNASSVINDPIDTPFSGTQFFDALLENEEYKARYHEYYNQLVEEYCFGGIFDETYQRIRNQIDELVETDPNAMYTYEEYISGTQTLYDTVMLRAESVRGQLNGTIPSTDEAQRTDSASLTDASHLDLTALGYMNNGGGHGGGRGGQRNR